MENESQLYTILQISDSAFPVGGFSHSLGTESAIQNLYMEDQEGLKTFVLSCLENAGSSCIPFLRATHEAADDVHRIVYLDSLHNASLLNHVAHKASQQQGKSFLATSCHVFHSSQIDRLKELADNQMIQGHLAIVFAVVGSALQIPALRMGEVFLFNNLRTIVASIVRLGKVGTVQAQRFQYTMQSHLDDILLRNWALSPEESFVTYPLPEVLQNSHDTLFAKLFFS